MATRKQSDAIDRHNAVQIMKREAGPRFNYTALSVAELLTLAEQDPRYGKDLLFTEVVNRLIRIKYPSKEKY